MAIDLTVPEAQPAVTYQGITRMDVYFPHEFNDISGAMLLRKPDINLRYYVTSWTANGEIQITERVVNKFDTWPAALITDMKNLYAKIEAHAQANGYIGAGTAEPVE